MTNQQAELSPDTLIIDSHNHFLDLQLKDIWRFRELIYFLAWRDLKVRYKQTLIGVGWNVFNPLFTMMLFTVVFSYFAQVPSEGIPYPIFAFTALLPWQVFTTILTSSSKSLVGNAQILTKVYFPRLIIPLSSTITPVVDFCISILVLFVMMIATGISGPVWRIATVPLFLFFAILTALAAGIWMAAFHVRYRDVGHLIPFLIQFWLYASPIAYPISVVPERWRFLYNLNPMSGVITGFRWALLDGPFPDTLPFVLSIILSIILLAGGILYFNRTENIFADIV
jgi:lipopolysaccharide transport system permease protein